MILTDISLATRIDAAECSLVNEWASEYARLNPNKHAFVHKIAGGIAAFAGNGSPQNKVAGLGFAGIPTDTELRELEALYSQRLCPVQIELPHLADPVIGEFLTRRGYALVGYENVLGRPPYGATSSRPAHGVKVTRCSSADFETWIDLLITGVLAPDVGGLPSHESFDRSPLESTIRAAMGVSGFVPYIASIDGVPAGGASMRMHQGIAQLCGAATLPAMRRRGVQSALLAARLREAAEAHCDLAVVTTQPGSKSHFNVQKNGFEVLYTRAVLKKG